VRESSPPEWAYKLVKEASNYLGVDCPFFRSWRQTDNEYTSGNAYINPNSIAIQAGTSRLDLKLALLHEVVHLKLQGGYCERNGRHSVKFYDTAWELFRWAKIPISYCLKVESRVDINAAVSYFRSLGINSEIAKMANEAANIGGINEGEGRCRNSSAT
jgi:hypothetical protein